MSILEPALPTASFDDFVRSDGERVRRGLVARYGVEVGSEAALEAMRVAWERWAEVSRMTNAAGYLFRVGQSHARPDIRWLRRHGPLLPVADRVAPAVEYRGHDELAAALDRLSGMQRAAMLLVRAHGYSYKDTAAVLGISEAAVANHLHRGTRLLRRILGDPT